MYLHSKGIAHRDLKPANILVTNQHYANMPESEERDKKIKSKPIIAELTDFGESRSSIIQTQTILKTSTKYVQRGTSAFMAPEQFPGPLRLHKANQIHLMQIDMWQLGMTIFCLANPNLKSPFELEFYQEDSDVIPDQFLGERLNKGMLPEMSSDYCVHRRIYWHKLMVAYRKCIEIRSESRASVEEIHGLLLTTAKSWMSYNPLSVSQDTALEEHDRQISSGKKEERASS